MSVRPSLTLVEMLATVSIFAIVMVMITGALQVFFAVAISERVERQVWSALEYTVEDMKREISLGKEYKTLGRASTSFTFTNQFDSEITYEVEGIAADGYGVLTKRFSGRGSQPVFDSRIKVREDLFQSDGKRIILTIKLQYTDGEGALSYIPKGGAGSDPLVILIARQLL